MRNTGFNALGRVLALSSLAVGLWACGDNGGGDTSCADPCITPPAPVCNGSELITFDVFGTCTEGQCVYAPLATVTCEDGCAGGACVVPVDPCDDVTCNTPPAGTCDGDTQVGYVATGTCNPDTGECAYTEARTDCAANGLVCDQGRCVTPGACDDVVCDDPPAPECRSFRAVAFVDGVCDAATAECVWQEQVVDCRDTDQVCRDGACADVAPCEGLDCTSGPAPYCEGSVAVTSTNSRCDATTDLCVADESRTDCFDLGLACLNGTCVESARCDDVVCDVIPAPFCRAGSAVTITETGACDPTTGTCRFEETVANCAALGLACVGGECVDSTCVGVVCSLAPPASCDGDTSVTWAVPGLCGDGRCTYDALRTDCAADGQICVSGACQDPPICDSVVCDTPPTATCDGDTALGYAALGTCLDGACSYDVVESDCAADGQTCRDGLCVDRCTGVVCLDTPDPYCVGETLRAPIGSGICDEGACQFSEVVVDCSATGQRCLDGGCRDICYGRSCEAPPAPTCEGDSALTFPPVGVCSADAGGCVYEPTVTNCAVTGDVCIDGACVPDPCLTTTCDDPPAPYCVAQVLRTPSGTGLCELGECTYSERTTNCGARGQRCINGDCRDRCYEVTCETPPAPSCDGDTLLAYADVGTCNGSTGACSYTLAPVNCAATGDVCRAGMCVPPPCRGITCDAPPASTCQGNVRLEYVEPGVCDEGLCTYDAAPQDCALTNERCFDGECVSFCEGVACDAPPAARCSGDVLLGFEPAGTCDPLDGLCDYVSAPRNCAAEGLDCRDGACQEPLCDGVVCGAPPEPYCSGQVLITPYGGGTCDPADGSCDFALLPEDCTLDGGRCGDGRCIAPCEDLVCATPPAAECQGDIAVVYGATGTCDAFDVTCDYPTTRTNCVSDGLVCRSGACVEPPCTGVTCDAPPASVCQGNTQVEFYGTGFCDEADGSCDYPTRRTDCTLDNGRCEGGRCVGPCEGVLCNELPDDFCGGTVAFSFVGDGVCVEPSGVCRYTPRVENCLLSGDVCRDGACVEPPCTGVVCNAPPAPFCAGGTAVAAFGAGTCEPDTGICGYQEIRTDCVAQGDRCENGQCLGPCDGVTCDDPPAPVCVGASVVSYAASGVCNELVGGCVYAETARNCGASGQICSGGACVDPPCTGVVCNTPAAPTCEGDVRVVEFGAGYCDPATGDCGYAATREDCALDNGACVDGACVEFCDLTVCDEVPLDTCEGDVAFTYSVGECNPLAQLCEYPATAINCATLGLQCRDGACITPPCQGVTCSSPAAPYCLGNQRIAEEGVGTCDTDTGLCDYVEQTEDCSIGGGICRAGECLDPCDFLVCNAPPADICSGDVLLDYSATGACNEFRQECEYTPAFVNCADGQICAGAACIEPRCEGVTCGTPPAPYCAGNTRITALGPGVCDEATGDCGYTTQSLDCAALGQTCRSGACVDRCAGVNCIDPPADFCDGTVARSYGATSGTCSPADGACSYIPTGAVDCAVTGQLCRAGRCVANPCTGVTCDTPPVGTCTGNVATKYLASSGDCNPANGSCSYDAISLNCTPLNRTCSAGECLTLCAGLTCNAPPAPSCAGTVAVTYNAAGFCEPELGECFYSSTFENCDLFGEACIDGACVPIDLCEGVVCDEPPPPYCSGNAVVRSAAVGICDEGSCVHAETTTPCGGATPFCEAGSCVAADPCVGVTCDTPPVSSCFGSMAYTYTGGVCANGDCQFTPSVLDCAASGRVCQAGSCVVPDPCDGTACDTPPLDTCVNGRAVQYLASGVCSDGDCTYSATIDDCVGRELVCVNGACAPEDPCTGVVCDTPPTATCATDIAIEFEPRGDCVEGSCIYPVATTTDCPQNDQICDAGACVDGPCTDVRCVSPNAVCVTDTVTRRFQSGVCVDGVCEFDEVLVDCAEIDPTARCYSGVCFNEDPCADVDCSTPPPPRCVNGVATTYTNPATCELGRCLFPTITEDCTGDGGFCVDGACTSIDPCDGVVCDAPPAPTCSFNTLVAYEPIGECADGACEYTQVVTNCRATGDYCFAGACQDADPCLTVDCDTPPGLECDGTVAVEYGQGSCNAGVCFFPQFRLDCARTGAGCLDGVCVGGDPCAGVVCDEPPRATCSGDSRVAFSLPGVCAGGACNYTFATTNCAATGQTCLLGDCVNPIDTLLAGDLVVTEFMLEPTTSAWIEVYNAWGQPVNLRGLEVQDFVTRETFTVTTDLIVPADGYVVFGDSAGAGGGADYVWPSTFDLVASSGTIRIRNAFLFMDQVNYIATWPHGPSVAAQLDRDVLDASDNDLRTNWCAATSAYSAGLFGTPGAANTSCP